VEVIFKQPNIICTHTEIC